MRIETATPADADTLARLNRHVHDLHVDHVPSFFTSPTHQEAAAAFGELLSRENARAFIAYDGDTPIGYMLLFIHERPANAFCRARRWLYLDQIGVEPGWQRRGVGSALVTLALQYAQEAGIDEVEVKTWAFNQVAQAFFRSVGFQLKAEHLWLRRESEEG